VGGEPFRGARSRSRARTRSIAVGAVRSVRMTTRGRPREISLVSGPLPMLCCLDVYHPLFNLGWVEGLLCSKTKERELSGRQLSRERHENERQQPSNLDTVVILLPGSVELEAKKTPYS
jgi:hypothetical protein